MHTVKDGCKRHKELLNTDISIEVIDSDRNYYSSITSEMCLSNGRHPINSYEVNIDFAGNFQDAEPFRQQRTKSRGKKVTSSYTNTITGSLFYKLTMDIRNDKNNVEVPLVPLVNPESMIRKSNTSRPTTVIQKYPKNNILRAIPPKHKGIVPGKNTYAEITTYRRKVCIFGDSIPQRLNMKKFNTNLACGYTFKRSFPSGTIKQLKHYITETINDDELDANVGLNSPSRQTDYEIVSGIIEMVHLCRAGGINDIFVSGLTHKDGFMGKKH